MRVRDGTECGFEYSNVNIYGRLSVSATVGARVGTRLGKWLGSG